MSEAESTQKAGTTPQDGADAGGSQTSGTPDGAGRDADALSPEQELAALREERNLWLQNKSKVEDANRLKAENEALQRQIAEVAARPQPTYGAVDPQVAKQQQTMADLQLAIQEAQWDAANGDRKSQLLVSLLQQQYQQHQYTMNELKIQSIPAEDQVAVRAKLATGRYADPDAAYEGVLGERWKRESASLKEREKEVEAAVVARKNGVTGTGRAMPVTAKELDSANKSTYTDAEFGREYDRIMSSLGPEAARGFASKLTRGQIKVEG